MKTAAALLACCVLVSWPPAAAEGEPCTFDAAGTGGDCRLISHCPELFRLAQTARPGDSTVARLRELQMKCPSVPGRGFMVCCQNEVTRPTRSDVSAPTPTPTPTLLPTEAECGQQFVAKVIGGENATIGEFPWMASIQYSTTPGAPLMHGCGGTLITARHVLTAAHCVTFLSTPAFPDLAPKAVTLGELNFDSEKDCLVDAPEDCADPPIHVEIDAIFAHKDFQNIPSLALPNDIAIIRLAQEVRFTNFVRPVCLLTDLSVLRGNLTDVTPESRGIVAGWGRSEISSTDIFTPVLQKATLPIKAIGECEREFQVTQIGLEGRICAGAGPNNEDTCRGDSGGPLMVAVKFGTFLYQTGISSFGTEACGQVAGYTRVLDYTDWILEQLSMP